jgi:hypothetical protein
LDNNSRVAATIQTVVAARLKHKFPQQRREIHTFYRRNNIALYPPAERIIVDTGATEKLIQQYQQVLSNRHERFSSDAVFGGAKYPFEKALLDELAHVRDADRAASLQVMFIELASFVSQQDYELVADCHRRAEDDPAIKNVMDLIEMGNHEAVQKELQSRSVPELVRYYALYRRVLLETEARRKQALGVHSLNADA